MKLISASALSLITLSKLTQAVYLVTDPKGSCLKLDLYNDKLKIQSPCKKGKRSQFTLENDILCLKDSSKCLTGKFRGRTYFGNSPNIKVYPNNDHGALNIDGYPDYQYRYSAHQKRFRLMQKTEFEVPTTEYAQWKYGAACWTIYTNRGSTFDKVQLEKCRTEQINSNQGKTQLWKFEDGKIIAEGGRRCLDRTGVWYVKHSLCTESFEKWSVTDAGMIKVKDSDNCLKKKRSNKFMITETCLRGVKVQEDV